MLLPDYVISFRINQRETTPVQSGPRKSCVQSVNTKEIVMLRSVFPTGLQRQKDATRTKEG